ncbi:MAG: hypothetical protein D8M28_12725 [Proteobacteria bacterium]|jgi:thioester reductase-like protein|nr:hypothetical protein [Pseudomonadota bacterium]
MICPLEKLLPFSWLMKIVSQMNKKLYCKIRILCFIRELSAENAQKRLENIIESPAFRIKNT